MNNDISYALTPKDVTALARAIITHGDSASAGRQTYLKSLLAGVQIEIHGKPVLRALRGKHKKVSAEDALAAFEKVNTAYYEAVLAAVPEGLSAEERNSKTNFARSSASTLRRAITLGWDVLTPVPDISKVTLSQFVSEKSPVRPMTVKRAQGRVTAYLERIAEMLERLPANESQALARSAAASLTELAGGPAPQAIRSVSLRRHESQVAAH